MLQSCAEEVKVWGEFARYNKEEGGKDVIPKEREHDEDATRQHRQVELRATYFYHAPSASYFLVRILPPRRKSLSIGWRSAPRSDLQSTLWSGNCQKQQ